MTADAFRRLGLFAAAVAVFGAIAAAGVYLSWIIALTAALGGTAGAIIFSLEVGPDDEEEPEPSDENGRAPALEVRERRSIERSARRAREAREPEE